MVEFDGGQNYRIWKVVQEFWPLVEERGVVLVALQNEVPALAKSEAAAKVLGDPPDQKRGLPSAGVENPGKHRSGRGFPVSPSDDQYFSAQQELVVQNLRQRAERKPLVQDVRRHAEPPL